MKFETGLIAVAALFLSAVLTGVVRRIALSHAVLDVPNDRSSHDMPTPRAGGVAIVLAASTAFAVLAAWGTLSRDLLIALVGGGTAVAAIGLLDDRYRLSAWVRMAVHVAAALWALAWLGGMPSVRLGDEIVTFGWAGYVLGAAGIVWTLNLYNFMDGIDGLAASEAIFIFWGGALLAAVAGTGATFPPAVVLGAACLGFLFWNWPLAKIFMGDVGSGYLGYVIAVLAIASAKHNSVALLAWLALGAVFFVDATVTLVRRLLRGERIHVAHRSHAYQHLARRWKSHQRVTMLVMAINLLWLLPIAWWCYSSPNYAVWIVTAAIAPLVMAAIWAGAGKSEQSGLQDE